MNPQHPASDDAATDSDHRPLSVADPAVGKTRLLSRQCATCIFRPGDRMGIGPDRLRELVHEARTRAGYIICHDTLPYHKHPEAKPAICRGFADRYDTTPLQLIRRLWGFVEVDPPGGAADANQPDD